MTLPLAGRTVLLTRDEGLADEVRALGAEVRVVTVTGFEGIPAQVETAGHDWIAFTSMRAVRYWPLGFAPDGPRIACVGPGSARAVEERGGVVSEVPEERNAASLARALVDRHRMSGRSVLFPCSSIARPDLPEILEAAGARVVRVPLYRPVRAEALPDGATDCVDVIVFLAPSSVAAFADLGGDLRAAPVLAIGPTTAEPLRERGVAPVIAPTADRAGILTALSDWEAFA